jgi:hypothetical protein
MSELTSKEIVPLGCRLGTWHRWSRWTNFKEYDRFFAGNLQGKLLVQRRTCQGCDAEGFRRINI